MNNKTYTLIVNSYVYSAISVALACASIFTVNIDLLRLAVISLFITALSILLSYIISEEEHPGGVILFISFIILLPVGMIVYITTFITALISTLIGRSIEHNKEGD